MLRSQTILNVDNDATGLTAENNNNNHTAYIEVLNNNILQLYMFLFQQFYFWSPIISYQVNNLRLFPSYKLRPLKTFLRTPMPVTPYKCSTCGNCNQLITA